VNCECVKEMFFFNKLYHGFQWYVSTQYFLYNEYGTVVIVFRLYFINLTAFFMYRIIILSTQLLVIIHWFACIIHHAYSLANTQVAYHRCCEDFNSCLQFVCRFHWSNVCFCMIRVLNTVPTRKAVNSDIKFCDVPFPNMTTIYNCMTRYWATCFILDSKRTCRRYANWGETGQKWYRIGKISEKLTGSVCTK